MAARGEAVSAGQRRRRLLVPGAVALSLAVSLYASALAAGGRRGDAVHISDAWLAGGADGAVHVRCRLPETLRDQTRHSTHVQRMDQTGGAVVFEGGDLDAVLPVETEQDQTFLSGIGTVTVRVQRGLTARGRCAGVDFEPARVVEGTVQGLPDDVALGVSVSGCGEVAMVGPDGSYRLAMPAKASCSLRANLFSADGATAAAGPERALSGVPAGQDVDLQAPSAAELAPLGSTLAERVAVDLDRLKERSGIELASTLSATKVKARSKSGSN
ncbi:MAG: hypothetical protein D6685_16015 [Bacteroidetes bacterium]|nr:MAG: hypothetical protein D6685_16015 [Bacteroidota bacterium]